MIFAPTKTDSLTLIAKPSRLLLRFNKIKLSSITTDPMVLSDAVKYQMAVDQYQKQSLIGVKESLQFYEFKSYNQMIHGMDYKQEQGNIYKLGGVKALSEPDLNKWQLFKEVRYGFTDFCFEQDLLSNGQVLDPRIETIMRVDGMAI